MKKLFLFIALIAGLTVSAQRPPNYTKINQRYDWISGMFDSVLSVPLYGAVPIGVRTNEWNRAGGVAIDTLNHDFYFFSDSTWRTYVSAVFKSGDSVFYALGPNDYFAFIDAGGSSVYVDSVFSRNDSLFYDKAASTYFIKKLQPFGSYLVPADTASKWLSSVYRKAGSDSVFYVKGGVSTFAFKDSLGSSGVNIYNTNGTLTGNRDLDGGGLDLRFNSVQEFGVGADTVNINTPVLLFPSLPSGNTMTDSLISYDPVSNKAFYINANQFLNRLPISDTSSMLAPYLRTTGDLAPLFTTSETLHNTDFTLSNTTQYKVFGRAASGSGVPSYVSIDTAWIANFSTMVRPLISAGAGVTYNSTTGVITATGGATNSNIGSGYRLAVPNTNNIKTLFGSGIITIDSTSNANALTIIGTEVDGSTTNEVQDFVNTSTGTSHRVALSLGGDANSDIQFVEGYGVLLNTTGSTAYGILTLLADSATLFQAAINTLAVTTTGSGAASINTATRTINIPTPSTSYVTSVATAGLISGGTITSTGTITTSMATNKLVGRGTAGTGIMEEITLGTNLALSGTTLNATDQYVGTVTSVTANDGNGFNFTVTNGTTAAVIDLTTTVTDGRVFYSDGQALAGAAGFTFDKVSAVTLGAAGSSLGTLNLTGNTSGTISIKGQAAAGTYNFNLPTTAGASGYALLSAGGGASPMTWGQVATGATNGTNLASGNVKLGGTLIETTTINTGGYTTTFTGSNSGAILVATNTSSGVGATISSQYGNGADISSYTGTYGATIIKGGTATNTTEAAAMFAANSDNTPTTGFGGHINFNAKSSTTIQQPAARLSWEWITATHGSTTSSVTLSAVYNTAQYTMFKSAASAGTATTTFGLLNSIRGKIALAGDTSGLITIQPKSVAGTWTLTLPTNDGDANQVLKTDGSGVTSWASVPRYTPLIVSAASYTTSTTIDADATDEYVITAQAGDLLFNAPTGTLVQGQKLIIRIKDNGGTRNLTWNAVFRDGGTPLPATTTGKTQYLGFVYNTTDTKWDFIAYEGNVD